LKRREIAVPVASCACLPTLPNYWLILTSDVVCMNIPEITQVGPPESTDWLLIYIDGCRLFNVRKVPNELGALAAIGAQLAIQIQQLISLINFLSYFTNLSNIFAAVTRTVKRTSFFRPLLPIGWRTISSVLPSQVPEIPPIPCAFS
jgi:hypothetical protein